MRAYLIAADDSNASLLKTNFEMLWQIAILEGIEKEIIEQLGFAYALTAISQKNKPISLGRNLPNFFGYLVGPAKVPITSTTEKNILGAINAIEFAHNLCLDQNKQYSILSAFKSCLSEFIRIAILYRNRRVYSKARKVLYEIRESAGTVNYKGDAKLPRMISKIDRFLNEIALETKKANLTWKI